MPPRFPPLLRASLVSLRTRALAVAPIAVAPIALAPLALAPFAVAPFAVAPIAVAAMVVAPLAAQRTPDVRLDTDAAGSAPSSEPQVAASGSMVFAVWLDQRGTGPKVYFNRSLDGGASWLRPDKRLDHAPGGTPCSAAHIAAAGASVYVLWTDPRNGREDLFFQRSLDGGTTWLPADVRPGTHPPGP